MVDDSPRQGLEILLLGWDGGGNVPPMVALGKHLVRRGHRVRMVGTDTMAGRALAAGIDFAPFSRSPSWAPRPGRALEDEMDAFTAHLLGPELGEELLAATNRQKPDGLVIDCMAGGALSAAEHLDLPAAVLVHLRARFQYDATGGSSLASRASKESLNRQRIRLGLDPLPVEQNLWGQLWRRAGSVFIASLPELEGPGAALPEGFTYVGGVFDPEPEPLPVAVARVVDDRTAPLVVISLSTTYMHQEQPLAAAVSALEGLRGVITVGGGLDPDSVATAADGVVVTSWAAHETLLPHADAVVTHAGHGTVMATLAAGVPLVCMPMGRDQHTNAEQIARLGAGITIDASCDANRLRAAIDEVITDPGYRERADKLAASMRQLGGGDRLASDLEVLFALSQPATDQTRRRSRGL